MSNRFIVPARSNGRALQSPLAAAAIFISIAPALIAQSASFAGALSILPFSPGISPAAVAIDASGNLFAADALGDQILVAHWTGTSYAISVAIDGSSGMSCPAGLALDTASNLFIADSCTMQVFEETPSSGGYIKTVVATASANGLNAPSAVAVDSAGNLYIADKLNGRVLRETPANGAWTQSVIASGLLGPGSLAVDASGNLYVADTAAASSQSQVLKLSPSSGRYTQTVIASAASGLNTASGVAIDPSGNVFIADSGAGRILLETVSAGQYTQSLFADRIPDAFVSPVAVALDPGASLYVADTGTGQVVRLAWPVANSGTVLVGAKGPAAQLTFAFSAATQLGPTPYRVLTIGAPNLEFIDAGTGTCAPGESYTAGSACTVAVIFAPAYSGMVTGAVTLVGAGGNTLATAPLAGIGIAPQLVHNTGAPTTVAANLGMVGDVAIDAAGNLYVTDEGSAFLNAPPGVFRIDPSTGATQPLGSNWQLPAGLALDGAGNLYVSDYAQAAVFRIAPNGALTQLPIALTGPAGLALDAAGNLFIADTAGSAVYKLSPSGALGTVGSGFAAPEFLAVDASGNLFVSDFSSGIYKVTPSGTQTLLTNRIASPQGIKIDAAGEIYVASGSSDDQVIQQLSSSSSRLTPLLTEPGTPYPRGIALDRAGNLFIANSNAGESLPTSQIVELVRTGPLSACTFATPTPVLTTDPSDPPCTVAFQNIGNQPLLFSAPTSGANPSYPPDFGVNTGDEDLCTSSMPLAPAAGCDISLLFSPANAGAVSAAATLTTNSLNQPAATQTVAVSGSAIGEPQTISFTAPPSPIAYGSNSLPLAATATSGLAVTFSILSGPGSLQGSTLTVTGAGTIVVAAGQPGGGPWAAAPQVTRSILVTRARQTIAFPGIKTPQAYGAMPVALSARATSGLHVAFTVVSGPATVKGSTLKLTGAGTVVVSATQAGNANYAAAPAARQTIVVAKARLTVAANNAAMRRGSHLPTLTAKISGFVLGESQKTATKGAPTTTTTASSRSKPGTYPIHVAAGTLASKNYSFLFVKGTLTITN